jgi:hypothetical protein
MLSRGVLPNPYRNCPSSSRAGAATSECYVLGQRWRRTISWIQIGANGDVQPLETG